MEGNEREAMMGHRESEPRVLQYSSPLTETSRSKKARPAWVAGASATVFLVVLVAALCGFVALTAAWIDSWLLVRK